MASPFVQHPGPEVVSVAIYIIAILTTSFPRGQRTRPSLSRFRYDLEISKVMPVDTEKACAKVFRRFDVASSNQTK